MTEVMMEDSPEVKPTKPLKKGSLVKVNHDAYEKSIESLASDAVLPEYIFEGPGELLIVQGDFGQVRWRMPVPDVWFRVDQLEAWTE